ncbi:MAG: DUF5399 family protein [Verrucomicrobia bacterium]|nr:DUF5399 family protein [Verrucomicrobiota bacterium]
MAKTNAVTIDNYQIEAHERYATDQSLLDVSYLSDANLIPRHFEIANSESTISSKWEELFETNISKHPFATFAPPPKFNLMRNRFFSYVISPEFDWVENEQDEEKEQREKKQLEEYKEKILSKKSKSTPIALLEKDRSALFNLLDSIQMLNGFLREVHARKLQYQKG